MAVPAMTPYIPSILYCATCCETLGTAKVGFVGRYFICPNQKNGAPVHQARVILDQADAKWWFAREVWLENFQAKWSVFRFFRKLLPKLAIGSYLLLWFVVFSAAIVMWPVVQRLSASLSYIVGAAFVIVPMLRVAEIVLVNASIVFTTASPANPIRTALYTMVAYIHVVLSFALFYLVLGSAEGQFRQVVSPLTALLFSVATITTVGYGNLEPVTAPAVFLVASELLFGLFFVAIIVAQVSSWGASVKREAGLYRAYNLRAETRKSPQCRTCRTCCG